MAFNFYIKQETFFIILEGNILKYDNPTYIDEILRSIKNVKTIDFYSDKLKQWDSTLVSVLFKIALSCQKANIEIKWQKLPDNLYRLVALALVVNRQPKILPKKKKSYLETMGSLGLSVYNSVKNGLNFLRLVIDSWRRIFSGRAVMRKIDFEFALENCGYKAVGIVSLVSFMVGLILAFVGAIQLKIFGAQIYIASLVAVAMVRIMGAIMAGIIIAGRTGAAYAATIGTMQVNEEIDALRTMGIPVGDFLILPRMMSLIITMPFLTMLADLVGMVGGAFVGIIVLDISPFQYCQYSLNALNLTNFLVGIFHGFVYGIIITCCGCYYGINCGRNADSVGIATTEAVVSSIVIMIVATGFLTLFFQVVGI